MSADRPAAPPVVSLSDWVVDPIDGDDRTNREETERDDPDADPGGAERSDPAGRTDRPTGDRSAGDRDDAGPARKRPRSRDRNAWVDGHEDREDSRQQVYDRLDAWRGQSHR